MRRRKRRKKRRWGWRKRKTVIFLGSVSAQYEGRLVCVLGSMLGWV
jgi:hypothetical protein